MPIPAGAGLSSEAREDIVKKGECFLPIHSFCPRSLTHIENWAVDLGWDCIVRFGQDPSYALPRAFFDDFVTVSCAGGCGYGVGAMGAACPRWPGDPAAFAGAGHSARFAMLGRAGLPPAAPDRGRVPALQLHS